MKHSLNSLAENCELAFRSFLVDKYPTVILHTYWTLVTSAAVAGAHLKEAFGGCF